MRIASRAKNLVRRLRLLAVLALLVPGLAVTVGTGVAHASPGHTISTASTLRIGATVTGGGGPVDFWKVPLTGGEKVNFAVNASTVNSFLFALYAPKTTDAKFPKATAFTSGLTNYQAKSTIGLQAPYTGTFILAVCEDVIPCSVANPQGVMTAYKFAAKVAVGISSVTAAHETKAGPTIHTAPKMPAGHFEAGGANAVDFWKLSLKKGDKLQFTVNGSTVNAYNFALYSPKTNDANFAKAVALSSGFTNDKAKTTFSLKAPSTGIFVLAVCENVVPCSVASKTAVMNPYTFTTKLVAP